MRESVNEVSKDPESIRRMFGSIAQAYDPANSVLSFGIHKHWKKVLVRRSGARPGNRILDCASGTGDLAFEFARHLGGQCEVVGTDFCPEMLEVAHKKLSSSAFASSAVRFEIADATNLSYADRSFDVASISFGIRNTRDPSLALSEMARVVKPGGRVMVLEFGRPELALIRGAFDWYSKQVLPRLGGWMSGQPDAYRYLQRSSAEFPSGKEFLKLAQNAAKFSESRFEAFQGGIAYLYSLTVAG